MPRRKISPGERLGRWLEAHRDRFPTDQEFAAEVECTPGRLSQVLGGARPSPALAMRIESAVARSIPFSAWFRHRPEQPQGIAK